MSVKSEWKLIENIGRLATVKGLPDSLIKGIGDDCAVYRIAPDRYGLFTTDISIENTHFILAKTQPEDIGYKAMMGNISDIAAMCGTPLLAFISIGIPDTLDESSIEEIYRGMIDAADIAGVTIAGGDTSRSEKLVLNICLYGETDRQPILRETASPEEYIYITGTTGDSLAGLEILLNGNSAEKNNYTQLVGKHNRPVARHDIVSEILSVFHPTSMIDISDGILSDMRRIAEASGCGFIIDAEKLPVSEQLHKYSENGNRDIVELALNSGEEYELIFTSVTPPEDMPFDSINNIRITCIGRITEAGYSLNREGKKTEAMPGGWDHFKKDE